MNPKLVMSKSSLLGMEEFTQPLIPWGEVEQKKRGWFSFGWDPLPTNCSHSDSRCFQCVCERNSVWFSGALSAGETTSVYGISECDSSQQYQFISGLKLFSECVLCISSVISLLGLLAILLII